MLLQSKLLLFLSATWIAAAQTGPVVSLTGPVSVGAGDIATLTLTLSGSTGKDIAAVQFSLSLPSGITLEAPSLSPAWIEAGFSIACGPALCAIVNATKAKPGVADGPVATVPVRVSPKFAAGTVSLPMTPIAATSVGDDAKAVAGAAYSIKVYKAPMSPGRGW